MNFEADVKITGTGEPERIEWLLQEVLADFHYSHGYCSEEYKVQYTNEPWMKTGVNNP